MSSSLKLVASPAKSADYISLTHTAAFPKNDPLDKTQLSLYTKGIQPGKNDAFNSFRNEMYNTKLQLGLYEE